MDTKSVSERAVQKPPEKRQKKEKTPFKKFLKNNYTGWLFNAPLLIGLLVFTLIPVVYSLYISFWGTNGINIWNWRGFANYVRMFTVDKKEMGIVCLNTFYYVAVSVPLGLVTSYLLAALVNTTLIKGVNTFRIIYYLPCMIPAVAAALLWTDMMKYTANPETMGIMNKILQAFGLSASRWFQSEGPSAIASLFFINLWSTGSGMILWLSAFKNIDRGMYEAADIEGASRFRKFISITIPMSTPMIFYNLINALIAAMQAFDVYAMVGRGPNDCLYFISIRIYETAFGGSNQYGLACSLGWLMFIVIAALTLVMFKTNKWVNYGEGE